VAVNKADEASLRTLLGYLFHASIETKVRQILKEMPHLTAEDIRQFANKVHALKKRMEAGELATEV
jgi:hypothetical protein